MKRCLFLVVMTAFFAHWMACTEAVIDDGNSDPIPEVVKYDPDVKAIMVTHCEGCHSDEPAAPGGFPLTTYAHVKNWTENENLVDRVNDLAAPMPPGGLMPENERLTIDQWIADGYLEN